MMITEVAAAAAQRSSKKDAAPDSAFNYAMAAAALEARASASLDAHGAGRAKDIAPLQGTKSDRPQNAATPTPSQSEDSAPSPAPSDKPVAQKAATPAPTIAAPTPQAVAPAPHGAVAAAIPAAAPIQNAPTQVKLEIGAREVALDRAKSQAPLAKAAPPPASPQSFAQLLTRKLDAGATEFELRLDPPELGKIHARLQIDSDGKALLALDFDNQAAFDRFSRDEAALRAALAEAGFTLAQGDLRFAFSAQMQEAQTPAAAPGANATPLSSAADHAPFAAVASSGFIDIRI